ncbi:MAG TPA: rRNA maturation RNase YbeY [Lentisphaeria bacterium]|nr:MAG: rRNA maturation RNase YbeY [Lentisphaerae bacterium GWF2_38_69]HBM17499.1 rRNA maturation RNase YbeY [Lentisphaeria bacterium]
MKVYYSKPKKSKLIINRHLFPRLVSKTIEFVGLEVPDNSAIVINFVSDKQIRVINSQYMKHTGITDVISFSYIADGFLEADFSIFSELFICVEKAQLEAKERNLNFAEELILYVVHGILHIAGLDDISSSKRKLMRKAETECIGHLKEYFNFNSIFALGISSNATELS